MNKVIFLRPIIINVVQGEQADRHSKSPKPPSRRNSPKGLKGLKDEVSRKSLKNRQLFVFLIEML